MLIPGCVLSLSSHDLLPHLLQPSAQILSRHLSWPARMKKIPSLSLFSYHINFIPGLHFYLNCVLIGSWPVGSAPERQLITFTTATPAPRTGPGTWWALSPYFLFLPPSPDWERGGQLEDEVEEDRGPNHAGPCRHYKDV